MRERAKDRIQGQTVDLAARLKLSTPASVSPPVEHKVIIHNSHSAVCALWYATSARLRRMPAVSHYRRWVH